MSEEVPPYGRILRDGKWAVTWNTYPDEQQPIMLSIEAPTNVDGWFATTVTLTRERARMMRAALDRALSEV